MTEEGSDKSRPRADRTTTISPAKPKMVSVSQKVVMAQYIFLRRDLGWPAGAMAAQAAHASVAAIAEGLRNDDEITREYISPTNLNHMTKYVYGVNDLESLQKVKSKWNALIMAELESVGEEEEENDAEALKSYWWTEQPEDVPSAFATWPVVRTNRISKFMKNLKVTFF